MIIRYVLFSLLVLFSISILKTITYNLIALKISSTYSILKIGDPRKYGVFV